MQSGQDVLEISPLVKSLNALLARIHAAVERERRWTANAAHELRTPLTGIKTHVQIAQMSMTNEPGPARTAITRDALHNAHTGVQQLQSTLEQLLQLARMESATEGDGGGMPMRSDAGEMLRAFEQACAQSTARAVTERPHWTAPLTQQIEPPPDDPQWHHACVALAPALLVSAITNLTDNALRHQNTAEPVLATLALRKESDRLWLEVHVRDHGPGMEADDIALSTQRFWRKTQTSQGSGLGLTIVQHIAESAGGELVLRAEHPGLSAVLRLPIDNTTLPRVH
ncbi:sensor histidine kinase [Diaphorobacter caeni]|uniref:sensor histidine kinase n=1 Tax=Diaphorobacter caeni TaxID=2784387 RepID=UPI002B26BD55|nr:ATP-binding protein [Diaphorobacter caeni]